MIQHFKAHFTNVRRNKRLLRLHVSQIWATLIIVGSSFIQGYSQVSNNSISSRTQIQIDANPVYSTTDQSTVEWQCINKKLTERCLIYHNDQWFSFTPTTSQTLFLNITNQQCKKKYGVQVVILEGNPCETSTYKLMHCESFTNQSDTFVRLDSMIAGKTYLINIDGFLGDVCGFEIQVANKPVGLPLKTASLDTLQLKLGIVENLVALSWTLPQALDQTIDSFEILRQEVNEVKSKCVVTKNVQFNTAGKVIHEYYSTDLLTKHGAYEYSIVGVAIGGKERILLDQKRIQCFEVVSRGIKYFHVKVPVMFDKETDANISIFNPANDLLLYEQKCENCKKQLVDIDVTDAVLKGIVRFWIAVTDKRKKQIFKYTFYVDDKGDLVMK